MDSLDPSLFLYTDATYELAFKWSQFLKKNQFDFSLLHHIDFRSEYAVIFDQVGNKFSIHFDDDHVNYNKKKSSIKKEMISRALGAGRYGLKVLDLSAGLAIDSIFLCQLGYEVKAVERNPLIFLALKDALLKSQQKLNFEIEFSSAVDYLRNSKEQFDMMYFDPMFPEKKKKSAKPRQEMVFFKNLVGPDDDADKTLELALQSKKATRIVVKRPLKAPYLLKKPASQIEGKLIRFDIYGV